MAQNPQKQTDTANSSNNQFTEETPMSKEVIKRDEIYVEMSVREKDLLRNSNILIDSGSKHIMRVSAQPDSFGKIPASP